MINATLPEISLNYQTLFESVPGLYLILLPDADFTIIAVSDAYLAATMRRRHDLIGRGIFAAFPDNPSDKQATGVRNLAASLQRVIRAHVPDTMAVQKYDIQKPASEGGDLKSATGAPSTLPSSRTAS